MFQNGLFIKNLVCFSFVFFALGFFCVPQAQAAITKLRNFESSTGSSPTRSLIHSGSKIYGVTASGGNNSNGVIYSINTNGTGYTILHHFAEATGTGPGGIILAGSTLYGVTSNGGNSDEGVIYSINVNGTGYTVLHHFADAPGRSNSGEMVYDSGTLYGTSSSGGDNNDGTVWSIQSNGSGFTVLHHFSGATDGRSSTSSLTKVGTVLYGTTNFGGSADDYGTLFSINTDGSNFTVLHVFDGANQGGTPQNQMLVIDGTKIYGETYNGGAHDRGTIFSMNTNGTGFTLLKSFEQSSGLMRPNTPLFYDSGTQTLYGGTQEGNETENLFGGIFSIRTDGSNYTEIIGFREDEVDGNTPASRPLLINGVLYGTTTNGGLNSAGVLFSDGTIESDDNSSETTSTTSSPPSSAATPPGCNEIRPQGISDLFQLNRTATSAKLYFTPVNDHVNRYHILYGFKEGDERFGEVSAFVSSEQNRGVQSITINHLDPNTAYWFKVAPVHGCAVGDWSNWLEAKKAIQTSSIFYRWWRK